MKKHTGAVLCGYTEIGLELENLNNVYVTRVQGKIVIQRQLIHNLEMWLCSSNRER
jgi:hypothetical protein